MTNKNKLTIILSVFLITAATLILNLYEAISSQTYREIPLNRTIIGIKIGILVGIIIYFIYSRKHLKSLLSQSKYYRVIETHALFSLCSYLIKFIDNVDKVDGLIPIYCDSLEDFPQQLFCSSDDLKYADNLFIVSSFELSLLGFRNQYGKGVSLIILIE